MLKGEALLEVEYSHVCEEPWDLEDREVEANKRRARERVRESKTQERIAKFYIFCVSIPAFAISAMLCWVIWRLFS